MKRTVLLFFTVALLFGSYIGVQRYFKKNKTVSYPAVSLLPIKKQAADVNGQIQNLENSLTEATKTKEATDSQYSKLLSEKNDLLKKR